MVRPGCVVVAEVFGQHPAQVLLIDNQQPVEQFPAQGTDHPLADRVRSGRLRRAGENPDALRLEYGVEGAGELARAIPDQELDRSCALAGVHQEVTRCLCRPRSAPGAAGVPRRACARLARVRSAHGPGPWQESVAAAWWTCLPHDRDGCSPPDFLPPAAWHWRRGRVGPLSTNTVGTRTVFTRPAGEWLRDSDAGLRARRSLTALWPAGGSARAAVP